MALSVPPMVAFASAGSRACGVVARQSLRASRQRNKAFAVRDIQSKISQVLHKRWKLQVCSIRVSRQRRYQGVRAGQPGRGFPSLRVNGPEVFPHVTVWVSGKLRQ